MVGMDRATPWDTARYRAVDKTHKGTKTVVIYDWEEHTSYIQSTAWIDAESWR